MKKNGFISTSLIYTFFIVFLLLMVLLIADYSNNRYLLQEYKATLKEDFYLENLADFNLYIYKYNASSKNYDLVNDVPSFGYYFNETTSYCVKGTKISFTDGKFNFPIDKKDVCYAYFDQNVSDITLNIYKKETMNSDATLVYEVPDTSNYTNTSKHCTNGASIDFNENKGKFIVSTISPTVCDAVFVNYNEAIAITYFVQDSSGEETHEGKTYKEVVDAPGLNYKYVTSVCSEASVSQKSDGSLEYTRDEKAKAPSCKVYFDIEKNDLVDVLLYIQTSTEGGSKGYTVGNYYKRVFKLNVSNEYTYVGSICDNPNTSVIYSDGKFKSSATEKSTCKAYFDIVGTNIEKHYYLQLSNGDYQEVETPPSSGYVYNPKKFYQNLNTVCEKKSEVSVDSNNKNLVSITPKALNDKCYIYFDAIQADIVLDIYTWNDSSQKWEIGSIPKGNPKTYSQGCTNGATIDRNSTGFTIKSEGPTICTVYYR